MASGLIEQRLRCSNAGSAKTSVSDQKLRRNTVSTLQSFTSSEYRYSNNLRNDHIDLFRTTSWGQR